MIIFLVAAAFSGEPACESLATALYRWQDCQLEVLVPRQGGPVVVKRVASNSLSIQGERLLMDASVRDGGVGTFLLENCSFIPVSEKEGFSDGFVVGSTSLAPDGTVAFFRSDAQHRLSLWLAIPETP